MSLKTESNSVSKPSDPTELSKPDANNFIESIMEDDVIDEKTKNFLVGMKNQVFMENVFDLDKKLVVNSIYLNKITKLGRSMSTMVWQYFRHRGKLNVNKLIKQYGRENLTINYKIFQ
jgi:hypothetical protein